MKKWFFLFVIIVFSGFLCVGCEQKSSKLASYKIDAVFDEEAMSLSCEQETTFFNTTGKSLDKLCFFLYANAFEEGQNPVSKSNFDKAYSNGESYGNITFQGITLNNEKAETELSPRHNILTINLQTPLQKNEEMCVEMQYVVSLANINHRLGYGDDAVNFGSFFPILCVFENGDFVQNGYSQAGDPFYSEVANFEVNITCPSSYIVASTGEILSKNNGTTRVKASAVRDFCFVMSKKFEKLSAKVNDFEVNYFFYDDEMANEHLQTACKAMKTFCEVIGEYPYKQISVVKTDFCFGGMEYPNLVMVSDAIATEEEISYVIVHELAHQWWYSLVGNNEFDDAWIDESLTEYSTLLFFEKHPEYGIDYNKTISSTAANYKQFVKTYKKVLGSVDEKMNRSLDEFSTEPEYVNCVYTKGVLLYDSIRERIGKKKFERCLKAYYKKYKFKNVKANELKSCFSRVSGRQLYSLFDAWLEGKVRIK